jgi:putative Ca2+/H+ antiporter (TMEM165/GDT1 family)
MSTPALPLTIVAAMVVGALGTTVIAVIAHGAGVAHSFSPLQPGAYIGLILCGVLGVLGGGVRWQTSPYND